MHQEVRREILAQNNLFLCFSSGSAREAILRRIIIIIVIIITAHCRELYTIQCALSVFDHKDVHKKTKRNTKLQASESAPLSSSL